MKLLKKTATSVSKNPGTALGTGEKFKTAAAFKNL